MKNLFNSILIVIILLLGCSEFNPFLSTDLYTTLDVGYLNLNIQFDTNGSEIDPAPGVHSRAPASDFITGEVILISSSGHSETYPLTIEGSTASASLLKLSPGVYHLEVNFYNAQTVKTFTGSTDVIIEVGKIINVTITLSEVPQVGELDIKIDLPIDVPNFKLENYTTIGSDYSVDAIACGDINNDNLVDIVASIKGQIIVFLQSSPQNFQSGSSYAIPTNSYIDSVEIADMNNDNRNDVIIGTNAGYMGIFYQNLTATLDPMVEFTTPNSLFLRVGDVNGDDLPDIVGTCWGGTTDNIDIVLQNNNGDLGPVIKRSIKKGGYDDLEIRDMNNDNLNDIIMMSGQYYLYDNIGILFQRSDNTMGDSAFYLDLGSDINTNGMGSGDLNGDGKNDFAVTHGGNSGKISLFLQQDNGHFSAPIIYNAYDCPETTEIGDMNNDGRMDLVVLNGGWNNVSVYLQLENGSLANYILFSIPYASHYPLQGLVLKDIDADNDLDLVIADYNHGVVILYNLLN